MKKVEHDALTNETIERDMTAEELDQYEADLIVIAEKDASIKAELKTKEAAKSSAKTKLAALGLNEEEVTALIP